MENVETHYEFLTGPLTNSKTKGMVDAKWLEITQRINALGAGSKLEVDKVKKKWFDPKSIAKKAVAEYNKEVRKTEGGTNSASTPTELQFRIARFIGPVFTEGIPETQSCNVAGATAILDSSPQSDGIDQSPPLTNVHETTSVSSLSSPIDTTVDLGTSEPPAKRQKICKRESQNEEIIQAEHEIKNAVVQIANELQKTNAVLLDIAQELKRRNQIDEQCRLTAPQQNRQQNYFNCLNCTSTNRPSRARHFLEL